MSTQDDKKFLQRAVDLAIENVHNGKGGPFGAVIVKDGKIIAEATNSVTTDNDPTAHAEVNAIRAATSKLKIRQPVLCRIFSLMVVLFIVVASLAQCALVPFTGLARHDLFLLHQKQMLLLSASMMLLFTAR